MLIFGPNFIKLLKFFGQKFCRSITCLLMHFLLKLPQNKCKNGRKPLNRGNQWQELHLPDFLTITAWNGLIFQVHQLNWWQTWTLIQNQSFLSSNLSHLKYKTLKNCTNITVFRTHLPISVFALLWSNWGSSITYASIKATNRAGNFHLQQSHNRFCQLFLNILQVY